MTFHANITYFDCYDWFIILKFIILVYFFSLRNNIEGIPQFNLQLIFCTRNETNYSPTGL